MSTRDSHRTGNNRQTVHIDYGPTQQPYRHDTTGKHPQHDSNELLALALLLDFLPHQQAHQLHQRFASEVLYQLPKGRSPLFLSRHDVMSWVNAV